MTKRELLGCVTRRVFKHTIFPAGETAGDVYYKRPSLTELAKKYPNGYSVMTENKLYAVPLEKFLEIAEEVSE